MEGEGMSVTLFLFLYASKNYHRMKHTTTILLLMAGALLAMGACSKGGSTTTTPTTSAAKQWPYPWQSIKLTGKDSNDVITSAGYDHTSNFYGIFIYKTDSYTICKRGTKENIDVIQSAATGYNLKGRYDTVELHANNGTGLTWKALYGTYTWAGSREYYQLTILTTTTFFNKTYTDSL